MYDVTGGKHLDIAQLEKNFLWARLHVSRYSLVELSSRTTHHHICQHSQVTQGVYTNTHCSPHSWINLLRSDEKLFRGKQRHVPHRVLRSNFFSATLGEEIAWRVKRASRSPKEPMCHWSHKIEIAFIGGRNKTQSEGQSEVLVFDVILVCRTHCEFFPSNRSRERVCPKVSVC